MNINLPLLLMILVVASGLIWFVDAKWFAPRRAQLLVEGETEKVPVLVEYARAFFPVFFIVFILRSFLAEPFKIPSASMVPTLLTGDYILVNKFTYGIRLPVFRNKVIDIGLPERGDVMVFYPPHRNKEYFIKRVIGLPGDVVTYRNKMLFVNNELVPHENLELLSEQGLRYQLGREQLGDTRFLMQNVLQKMPENFSVVVKPGHYFMMGDNRDNSLDSRAWGQVPERDIVGKAFAIWMHWPSLFSIPSFGRAGAIE